MRGCCHIYTVHTSALWYFSFNSSLAQVAWPYSSCWSHMALEALTGSQLYSSTSVIRSQVLEMLELLQSHDHQKSTNKDGDAKLIVLMGAGTASSCNPKSSSVMARSNTGAPLILLATFPRTTSEMSATKLKIGLLVLSHLHAFFGCTFCLCWG